MTENGNKFKEINMLELKNSRLVFSFPEVHPDARCEIEFQRTLRIPDDDKTYPLPPGCGAFPVLHTEDFKANLSEDLSKRGGVMIPMYQSEALWMRFTSSSIRDRSSAYPFAVKIAAGKRSAVTGKAWTDSLQEKDYVVLPSQPWLDGFMVKEGTIRQFVAAPLNQGFTVEEQLTGVAEFGGLQIEVYPMKAEEFEKRFPVRRPEISNISESQCRSIGASSGPTRKRLSLRSSDIAGSIRPQSMGMAAGGHMKQAIHPDNFGLEVWDTAHKSRSFVHLLNSLSWQQVTQQTPPTVPMTAKDYTQRGLPWFEHYSDAGALGATDDTAKIKSVQQMAVEKGYSILPENESVTPAKPILIVGPKNQVIDGEW